MFFKLLRQYFDQSTAAVISTLMKVLLHNNTSLFLKVLIAINFDDIYCTNKMFCIKISFDKIAFNRDKKF